MSDEQEVELKPEVTEGGADAESPSEEAGS